MPLRPPRLRELETFRALLQHGSVTEAATRLGISQPAVSKTLRQLEAALGFRLFVRGAQHLSPTPEAEALLPRLEGVFASVLALAEAGAALREGRAGRVRVAAVPSLANAVLPAVIAAAAARHPGLTLGVQVGDTRQVVEWVTHGAAEVGLVHDLLEDPRLATEELGGAGIACVVPGGHPFARRRIVEPRDLKGLAYVSYAAASPIGRRMATVFEEVAEDYAPHVDLGASTAICAVVQETGMPGLVEDYVPALGWWQGLVTLPLAPPVPLRPRLLTAAGKPLALAAEAFTRICRDAVMAALSRPRPRPGRTAAAPPRAHPTSADADGS